MIAAAGGIDALAPARVERSRTLGWDEIAAARPEAVVVMPCGLYAEEAEAEARRHLGALEALGAGTIHAVDAASSFSRPGPRLADGVELLGHLLHPGLVAAPAGLEARHDQSVKVIPCLATMIAATKQTIPTAAIVASSAGSVSRREI